jgi:hypothetical protein
MAALFRQSECEGRVKILIASTLATGHLNPLLTIGRILIAEGHEVVGFSGSALREPSEAIGAEFRPLPAGADFDLRDILSVVPELKNIPQGPQWLRAAIERVFIDTIPAQHKGLEQVLRDFAADVMIGDNMIFGVLPMLLGLRSKRPPIVLCGTSILHWRREDGAPHFAGLPPATTQAQLKAYAAISREHDKVVNRPVARRLNRLLKSLGVGLAQGCPGHAGNGGKSQFRPLDRPDATGARERAGSARGRHRRRPSDRCHTWPDSQQCSAGQLFTVRMGVAEGGRVCHQRGLWQSQPGYELWNFPCHGGAD